MCVLAPCVIGLGIIIIAMLLAAILAMLLAAMVAMLLDATASVSASSQYFRTPSSLGAQGGS